MNKSILLFVLLGVVIIAALSFVLLNRGSDTNNAPSVSEVVSTNGFKNYLTYSEENLKAATKGRTLLFFHAGWCPTCRTLENDIKINGNKLPEDLTILKIDYDTASALKTKYNVVTQHTLVQTDKDGNEITKWIGGNIDVILEYLQEA